jgi:hypothetical protein
MEQRMSFAVLPKPVENQGAVDESDEYWVIFLVIIL